jgi:hypothetical protein
MDRIERIDGTSGIAQSVSAVIRDERTDPDGSRRDHPPGEGPAPREHAPQPRPAPVLADDGLPHVDVQA